MSSYCKWTRTIRTNSYLLTRYEIDRLKDNKDYLESLSLHINYPSAKWMTHGDCAEYAFDRSLKPVTKSWKCKKKYRQYLRHEKSGCTKGDMLFARNKKDFFAFEPDEISSETMEECFI